MNHILPYSNICVPQLASDETIKNNPDFENGSIKIQDGLESQFTPDEQDAVHWFLKPVVLEDADEIEKMTYDERILHQKIKELRTIVA